jgi:hypothetical protein
MNNTACMKKKLWLCLPGIAAVLVLTSQTVPEAHEAITGNNQPVISYAAVANHVTRTCNTSIRHSPVSWSFTAKKTADKTYEVHISATISEPWSIYSQHTPEGGPFPTHIVINKNPLIVPAGTPKEVGTLHRKHEEVFDVDVLYYTSKVNFVQTVKLKAAAKTNITGSVEFMACNNEQCLLPQTISFTIPLQ